jgi:hypothetical protein
MQKCLDAGWAPTQRKPCRWTCAAAREVQRVQGKFKTTRGVQNLQGEVKGSQLTREYRKFLTMYTVNLSKNSGEMGE